MSPPTSGPKDKPSKKKSGLFAAHLHIGFVHDLLFEREDVGDTFLRNVD
jgi:hypothetical protein